MSRRVVGGLKAGKAFSSRVRARSIAAVLPSVPTLTASTPRVPSRAAGTFAAGQVIPAVLMSPSTLYGLYAPATNFAAVAPAGQRPRTGMAASCAHETTSAGTGLALPEFGS